MWEKMMLVNKELVGPKIVGAEVIGEGVLGAGLLVQVMKAWKFQERRSRGEKGEGGEKNTCSILGNVHNLLRLAANAAREHEMEVNGAGEQNRTDKSRLD